jgi:hypothetical protein
MTLSKKELLAQIEKGVEFSPLKVEPRWLTSTWRNLPTVEFFPLEAMTL